MTKFALNLHRTTSCQWRQSSRPTPYHWWATEDSGLQWIQAEPGTRNPIWTNSMHSVPDDM